MELKRKPNLYLTGFMGTGKSSVGRLAAQRLGLEFVDSDVAIEAAQGRGISEIFATEGEKAFRKMERAFVETGHQPSGMLVACGGGLVVEPGMMDLVKGKGLVIALIASARAIYDRVKGNRNRPLLLVDDPMAEIERMLAVREPVYREAHVQILTEGRSLVDVVNHVCRSYKLETSRAKA